MPIARTSDALAAGAMGLLAAPRSRGRFGRARARKQAFEQGAGIDEHRLEEEHEADRCRGRLRPDDDNRADGISDAARLRTRAYGSDGRRWRGRADRRRCAGRPVGRPDRRAAAPAPRRAAHGAAGPRGAARRRGLGARRVRCRRPSACGDPLLLGRGARHGPARDGPRAPLEGVAAAGRRATHPRPARAGPHRRVELRGAAALPRAGCRRARVARAAAGAQPRAVRLAVDGQRRHDARRRGRRVRLALRAAAGAAHGAGRGRRGGARRCASAPPSGFSRAPGCREPC